MQKKSKVIGREREKEEFNKFLMSNNAEFMAIYGRRRVGKTYLVRNFFANKPCLFFNVTGIFKEPLKRQLHTFAKELGRTFFHGAEIKGKETWFDTFELLSKAIEQQISKRRKVVLFFDEFPWMATPRSKLVQALEYYWNHHWSQDNRIKLIICGSAASWIIRNIVDSKGGLHNRLTRTVLLEPMNLKETKSLLHDRGVKLNNRHITQVYMVTGGIPFYLSHIPPGLSQAQIIEKLAFSKNGVLFDEFDKLYASLFSDATLYSRIVRAIASRRYGMHQADLFAMIDTISKGGTISKKLKELEDAGFIMSFKPLYHKRKGVFYKVIDEYSLFYLHWIEPIKSTVIKNGIRAGYWDKMRQSPSFASWAGYAFEALSYKHLDQVCNALSLSPSALPSTWRHVPKKGSSEQGAQIDLLFDRDDNAITICEIKYTNAPFAIDKEYAAKLRSKLSVFAEKTKTQKQLFLAIIAAGGLKKTMYSEEMVDEVVSLTSFYE